MPILQHHFAMLNLETYEYYYTYKAKKFVIKFPDSSGRIKINFQKFSARDFQTHSPKPTYSMYP